MIPAGTYRMGSPEAEGGRGRSEGPLHDVRIQEKLAVGRYEVTRGEYGDFVKETGRQTTGGCWVGDGGIEIKNWRRDGSRSWRSPGFRQGDGHPVVCVSWEDARAYAEWLSEKTGETYRLLSEAEWEYAARAGPRTSRYWGDSETGQCRHANGADAAFGAAYGSRPPRSLSCRDGSAHTAEVGRHGANAWRLSDMLGNVWEWVEDCWHENYKGAPKDGSAWVPEGRCEARVVRGGSWYSWSHVLRSAGRSPDIPVNRNFDTGFRVARTLAWWPVKWSRKIGQVAKVCAGRHSAPGTPPTGVASVPGVSPDKTAPALPCNRVEGRVCARPGAVTVLNAAGCSDTRGPRAGFQEREIEACPVFSNIGGSRSL